MKNYYLALIVLFGLGVMRVDVKAQYVLNFEAAAETKTGYASGNVTLNGISWNMTDALIGNTANDKKNGSKSARIQGTGSMTMQANKSNGAGIITLDHARFSTDAAGSFRLDVSTDNGGTWTAYTSSTIATSSASLVSQSFTINLTGNVRVRIVKLTGGNRINIDDISIGDYTVAAPEINLKQSTTNIATGGTHIFGNQAVNTSSAATTFTIENTGSVALDVSSLTLGGTDAGEFALDQTGSNGSIAAGGSRTFTVVFSPTSVGTKTANISISNDDANENPYIINLTGTGVLTLPTGPTVFKPGDLVIVGYDANVSNDDEVYIMTMVDIRPSTQFSYVNSRFEAGAPANVRTMRWGGSGDQPYNYPGILTFTWDGASNISKGSIIKFINEDNNVKSILINGTEQRTSFVITTHDQAPNIANSGSNPDQMWLVQGTFTSIGTPIANLYSLLKGRVLFGLTSGTAWVPFTSAVSAATSGGSTRQSRLHPDLQCFNVERAAFTKASFYNIAQIHTGTKRVLLSSIKNVANWTNTTTIPASRATTSFTVDAGNIDGYWVGNVSTDWFDCSNWEALTVPDRTTDVRIDAASSDNANINYAMASSDIYGDTAKCHDLSIQGRKISLIADNRNIIQVNGNMTLSNSGELDMNDNNNNTQDGQMLLHGNFRNERSEANFNQGNSTVHFVGSNNQTIENTTGTKEIFYRTTINKPFGQVQLLDSLETNRLVLTNGKVLLDNMNVILTDADVASRVGDASAASYLITNARGRVAHAVGSGVGSYTFPVGDDATEYSPVSVNFTGVTAGSGGRLFGQVTDGRQPNLPAAITKFLSRYWNMEPSNLSAFTYNITTTFLPTDYEGGLTAGSTVPCKWSSGAWSKPGAGSYITGNDMSWSGLTSFSDFTGVDGVQPLPVSLIRLRATLHTAGVARISWSTASETGNYGFEVQKSSDNKHFIKIGFVNVNGNSQTLKSYVFDDVRFGGPSYYRLKQIDTDGKSENSNSVYLNSTEETRGSRAVLFPVPVLAGQDLTVDLLDWGNAPVSYTIISATGAVLSTRIQTPNAEGRLQINMAAGLASGLYHIRLQGSKTSNYSSNFIIGR